MGGSIVALLVVLLTLLTTEKPVEFRRTPNRGTTASIRNAIVTATIIGLTFGTVGAIRAGLSSGLLTGLPIGLAVGMYGGGVYAIRHYVIRLFLWQSGAMPLKSTQFLNFAAGKRSYFRKAGAGYKFMHRLLQEHLASERTRV